MRRRSSSTRVPSWRIVRCSSMRSPVWTLTRTVDRVSVWPGAVSNVPDWVVCVVPDSPVRRTFSSYASSSVQVLSLTNAPWTRTISPCLSTRRRAPIVSDRLSERSADGVREAPLLDEAEVKRFRPTAQSPTASSMREERRIRLVETFEKDALVVAAPCQTTIFSGAESPCAFYSHAGGR